MGKSDRVAIFGKTESGYLWCLHCNRTYKEDEYRTVGGMDMCYYEDCNGDAVIDAWDWEKIKSGHPEYPDEPEKGVVYSQFG